MIDNFEQIKSLLKFENENDFYFIQVLQRSKENPELGKNNRLLKPYYIYSLEQLEKYKKEMILMANTFNARIYIHLNRRNAYKIALELMEDLAHNINSNHLQTLYKGYSSVCGKHHSEHDKTWVVDVDTKEGGDIELHKLCINRCRPTGRKIITSIETKNGFHLITKPFNSEEYKYWLPNYNPDLPVAEIHKNNPTILYIP